MEIITVTPKKDRATIPNDRVICPLCWENNQTSTIRLRANRITQKEIQSYYDEEGLYHSHDGNVGRGDWSCSNKHYGEYVKYTKCPNCNYGNGNIKLTVDNQKTELKKDISETSVRELIFPPTMSSVSKAWNIF